MPTFYEKTTGTTTLLDPREPIILSVGLTCLDIVTLCNEYPKEDSDQRCIDLKYQRGGNASNNCTVISQLNYPCEFLGTLDNSKFSQLLQDDMRKHNINFSHCPIIFENDCPTSVVMLSNNTGSRTITHFNNNKIDLKLEDFKKLHLKNYSWIYFEGINISEVLLMMQWVDNYNKSLLQIKNESTEDSITPYLIMISVELEKMKLELLDLLPYADVVFVSRDFAESQGYKNMEETLRNIREKAKPGAIIFSAWGDQGAMAQMPNGSTVRSPAFPPEKIIDTLGAGDTFNAAIIYYLNKEKIAFQKNNENKNIEIIQKNRTEFISRDVLQNAITFGCKLAGAKIGLRGFDSLNKVYKQYL